ncbi:RHS repeat-associated core domain-containing protein [Neisseria sp. CP9]|uniref:RHS repeat-associated core domain-containing protein n=1 Tax=Neisseria sp. CP9 TaxID=3388843 RepID=UPI0039EDFE37
MPSKEENARNGLPDTDWRDAQYDMLYLPVTETVRYHYDFNGNRTATVLPDGRQINYLYYGSGHLHQISLDDEVITDIERDQLHREIYRTQGKLASRYELDPLGRLKRQIATLNDLTEGGKGKTKVAEGLSQTAVKRSYGYDRTDNLTHSTDQRTGTTQFEYDKLGRITQAGNERFAFDPAHNILDIPTEKVKPYPAPSPVGEGRGEGKTTAPLSDDRSAITDNRLKTYNGTTYYYDDLGNLIHREVSDGEVQNYFYDLHDQLVKAEIFKKDGTKETWSYTYDALGRRIGKGRLKNEEVSETSFPHDLSGNDLENQTRFVWDGSHLLQEIHPDGRYTYIYTDPDSYEPLAQVRDWTTEDDENRQQTRYFHCDQIGIPREMTDKDGNLLWFGNYTGWGRLKEETRVTDTAYQPFRLQNQYADRETGLHYNFFRYYEPDAGRFVNQDPIGLYGGDNFYQFAPNIQLWLDVLGLCRYGRRRKDGKCPKKRGPKRKGGAHNKTISALAKEVERCGGKVVAGGRKGKPERVIDTPGGHKESRRPDITWIDSSGITHHGNVGKGHKRPILREREAIEDLEKALAGQPDTHEKVTFWSYTNSKCQPKLCD